MPDLKCPRERIVDTLNDAKRIVSYLLSTVFDNAPRISETTMLRVYDPATQKVHLIAGYDYDAANDCIILLIKE